MTKINKIYDHELSTKILTNSKSRDVLYQYVFYTCLIIVSLNVNSNNCTSDVTFRKCKGDLASRGPSTVAQ